MRILIFGASITQGFWDTTGGWVQRLRTHYDAQWIIGETSSERTVFNLGISGDDSHDIRSRIVPEVQSRQWPNDPAVVIVEVGTNDASVDHGSVRVPLEAYRDNLTAIIKQLDNVASTLIFVGLPPCDEAKTTPVTWGDYHYTNHAISSYEESMREIAGAHNTHFIPVFDAFKQHMHTNTELFHDGLHPNNTGHKLLFEIIQPQLEDFLSSKI